MIDWINDKRYWQPALDQDGNERTDGWVINAMGVIPLQDYPPGTKLFLRAELLHPGASPSLLEIDGHWVTAFLTNSPRWHGPFLDAPHRARGRCENRIKTLKAVDRIDGQSRMRTALRADIPGIIAECGGDLSCATCHVYVAPEWYDRLEPPIGNEEDLLEAV